MDEPPSTLPPAFYSPTLFKSSIQLSLPPSSSSSSSSPTTTSIEPLPHLNYHLLHLLIALARPHLTKRELKRYDYLADARRCYYEALYKFQRAYRELLDAYSHGEALDHEFDAVANRTRGEQGEEEGGGVRQLCEVELARRKNNQHMRDLLEAVREKSRMRAAVTAWFSNLKWTFMKGGGWAVLEEVGRRSWRFVVLQQQHEMKDGIGEFWNFFRSLFFFFLLLFPLSFFRVGGGSVRKGREGKGREGKGEWIGADGARWWSRCSA